MQQLVSILIPVYQAEKTIAAAMDSCLAQTYRDIEILLLDDASTDGSPNIISSFQNPRISIFRNEHRMGIASCRNTLLEHASGTHIAWLDADDLMQPERIEQQMAFMTQNPGVDIAGSWIYTDWKDLPVKKLPLLHHQIRTMLWFKNCMIQPSVISRNFYKQENIWYNTDFTNSVEDYELWWRLSDKKQFANIPLMLTTYHMTTGDALEQKQSGNAFKEKLDLLWEEKWKEVAISISREDKNHFRDFLYKSSRLTNEEAVSVAATLRKLSTLKQDSFYQLVLSYQKLRLWKQMSWGLKTKHLALLINLVWYPAMKRNFLI
jgi:glycosyltransferase involved in cell wall biosynthesis